MVLINHTCIHPVWCLKNIPSTIIRASLLAHHFKLKSFKYAQIMIRNVVILSEEMHSLST